MIVTNIPFSSFALFSFWKSVVFYLRDHLPMRPQDVWCIIEGYWPGFQINSQERGTTHGYIPDATSLNLKPTSVEIEERLNFPWRVDTLTTHAMYAHFLPPVYSGNLISVYLKLIRVRGTFDVDIYTPSSIQTLDHLLHALAYFNNRWRYLDLANYPLTLPLRWMKGMNEDWAAELARAPNVYYAYIPYTGEYHYFFSLNLRPLVKLTGVSYTPSQEELMWSVTCSFEFNTSLPTWWILDTRRRAGGINIVLPIEGFGDILIGGFPPDTYDFTDFISHIEGGEYIIRTPGPIIDYLIYIYVDGEFIKGDSISKYYDFEIVSVKTDSGWETRILVRKKIQCEGGTWYFFFKYSTTN